MKDKSSLCSLEMVTFSALYSFIFAAKTSSVCFDIIRSVAHRSTEVIVNMEEADMKRLVNFNCCCFIMI